MNDSPSYTTQYQDVDQSICPANWTLPKGGDIDQGPQTQSGSFQYLVSRYGWDSDSYTIENPNIWNTAIKSALSGYWYGSLYSVGGGYWWSPVVDYSYGSYDLLVTSDNYVDPNASNARDDGFPVRCLAR